MARVQSLIPNNQSIEGAPLRHSTLVHIHSKHTENIVMCREIKFEWAILCNNKEATVVRVLQEEDTKVDLKLQGLC